MFGSIVHAALERIYGAVQSGALVGVPDALKVQSVLGEIEAIWKAENPISTQDTRDDFQLTLMMAESILPTYFRYWKADDFGKFEWIKLEHEFKLPYTVTLPPTLTVGNKWRQRDIQTFIRGKMDGLYRDRSKGPQPRLLETKTKGRIDPGSLEDIMPHQLQPNIYLKAAREIYNIMPAACLLNVIRRPQLRQKVKESITEFGERVALDIRERPDFYFIRLEMQVSEQDYNRFDAELSDLMLDFVMWKIGEGPHYKNDGHCENKYGTCAMLPICGRQFYEGHFRRPKVFSELEEI